MQLVQETIKQVNKQNKMNNPITESTIILQNQIHLFRQYKFTNSDFIITDFKVKNLFFPMTSKQFSSLIISLLLTLTTSNLVIRSPASLKKYFTDKYGENSTGIQYSLANFGDVPYGRSIVGELTTPTVLENCVYEDIPNPNKTKKIILSERNDCKFTQKALNTQKQGGIMSIIMDNVAENPSRIIMIDDGHGSQIHIPTILISLKDGQKILQTLKNESVSISITFDTNKSEKAKVSMYLDITDRNNFIFLRKLKPFFEKIRPYVDLSVNYATVPCRNCADEDCFYNKAYCKKILFGWVPNAGQIFIKEQLREYFIFQEYPDKWWSYMDNFDEYCSETTQQGYLEDCSINAMKMNNIDSDKIIKLVEQSFKPDTNPVLQQSSQERLYGQILYYPSIIVNNITYRGNLQAYQVHELVCNSLNSIPAECQDEKPFEPKSSHIILWIVLGIVGFLVLLIFIIVCYRRFVRRQLTNNMNKQVNELVNQYITMYEADKFKGESQLKENMTE